MMGFRALAALVISFAFAEIVQGSFLTKWGIAFISAPVETCLAYMKAFNDCDVGAMSKMRASGFKLFLPNGRIVDGKAAALEFDEKRCDSSSGQKSRSLIIEPDSFSVDGPLLTMNYTASIERRTDIAVSESWLFANGKILVQISTADYSRL